MSNFNSLPYYPKGSPQSDTQRLNQSSSFSAPKQYQRLKSLTSVVGTFNRLRMDKLTKRRSRQPLGSSQYKNQHPDFKGVSLIQASRNGWTEVVKALLDSSSHPEQLIGDVDEEGFTALHYAARYNQVEVMKMLVRYGADINVKQGQDEVRPLHLASRYNSEAAVFFLIGQMAPVNIKDVKGRTPLHYATRKGHGMIIKLLISVSNCRVNEPDNDKTTPLIMAALQGSDSICESLISRGAEVELKDVNNMTALMWAAAEGHTQVCKVLLKAAQRHGTEAQRRYMKVEDKEGNTALHLAVQNGGLEVVNLLLCHGAEVDSFKKNRASPLHLAATNGFVDIVKVLIFNGADVNAKDIEQMTPVHRAALYNKVEVLEFLVKKGADVNAKDKKNMSPLHCASWKGQIEALEFLLSCDANVTDIDITLKSALHWAVQYGHFQVVKTLLKQKSGQSLVSCTDKNDQTVLHYAAYTGDVQTLLLLLEAGARPDAKDQEERSPLHIAAQNDRVSCIEALIQSSNHETNDDDLDGRTPLLLACLSGHHQAVQVLLSLGSDVSRRDDEHCTALMLAASQGHSLVMKILLDNHAAVNDVDKMRNTPLHYACAGGHVDAVQLLLDRKSDVVLKNTHFNSALDLAIDNLHQEVVIAMLKDKSTCQDCMTVRDEDGHTPIDRLIAKLPETVLIILDHCVERTSRDDEERNLTMSFDYQYIDPGPDDPSCSKNRYFALNTMVAHGRDMLLSHPLCQNLLFQKWVGFGRNMFILNLLTYIGYLTCLTVYVTKSYAESTHCPFFNDSAPSLACVQSATIGPPVYNRPSTNGSLRSMGRYANYAPEELKQQVGSMIILMFLLYFFVGVFFLRDLIKIISQKFRYFLNIYNTIVWMLMLTTVIFVADEAICSVTKWRAGWMAMFLAWINFIMYLRRIDFLGIYVIMFVSVLSSLVKLILVFFMFCGAFVGSLYIVLAERFLELNEVWKLFIRVLVMTLGEIDKDDRAKFEFNIDGDLILLIFLFLMPIALMNLMIGVAVGDIEKIQKNAYLKRIGLQVDLMYNIENNMPRLLQKKVHIRKATIKPNEGSNSRCSRVLWCFAKQRKVQFIQAEKKDQMTSKLESLMEKMHIQHQRTKTMMLCIQQQGAILQQIAQRLDINVSSHHIMPPIVPAGCYGPSFGWGGDGGGPTAGGGLWGLHGNLSTSTSQLVPPASAAINPLHQKLSLTSSGLSTDQGHVTSTVIPVPESVSVYANVNLEGVDRWRKRSIRPAKTAIDGVGRPRSFI